MSEKAALEVYLKTGEILRCSSGWKNRPVISGFHSLEDTNGFEDSDGNVYLISATNISYVKILKETGGHK
jgi:hypothetical protein